ncbi:MAG: hypothetical protein HGA22_06230 [Clostridiales bacterium]|nr:hypothetical protein [Clostridiales bacterium]
MLLTGCGGTTAATAGEKTAAGTAAVTAAGSSSEASGAADSMAANPSQAANIPETTEATRNGDYSTHKQFVQSLTAKTPLTDTSTTFKIWVPMSSETLRYYKENSMDNHPAFLKAEELTGVKIKWEVASIETAREQFNLMVSSNDFTDMISGGYYDNNDQAIKDGVYMKLNDLVEQNAPNYSSILKSNEDIRTEAYTSEGNIALFYVVKDEVANPPGGGPFIRKDFLDKVGITDLPVTYDEYYNVLKAFKEKLGCDSPILLTQDLFPMGNFLSSGYGLYTEIANRNINLANNLTAKDGKLVFSFTDPGMKEYLIMLNKWYQEGLINKDFLTVSGDPMGDGIKGAVASNKAGIFYTMQPLADIYGRFCSDKGYTIAPILDARKNKDDKLHVATYSSLINSNIGNMAITTQCSNPALAAKWCDFWYGREGSMLANYGIEGDSYKLDAGGAPAYTDIIINNPDIPNINQAVSVYTTKSVPTIEDDDRVNFTFSDAARSAFTVWNTNRDDKYYIGKKTTLTGDEATNVTMKFSDISTFILENVYKFVAGEKSFDEYDAYVQKINDMGLQECIDSYQKVYDKNYKK